MRTAVSVPDPVFRAAERLVQRLGISRSQLYSRALRAYFERYDADETTRRLNEVYAKESSELDPVIAKPGDALAAPSLP